MYEIQSKITGLETDQFADIGLYLGDLNYRLKTSFADLNNSNVQTEAIGLINDLDQLLEAKSEGYYPNYEEMEITFDPSYKMYPKKNEYFNKKNQAPSYTDRVLYKNNTSLTTDAQQYQCHHDMFGSDHRPVSLLLKLKNFKQPSMCDLSKLLNINKPRQGYGELKLEIVEITDLNFELIKTIKNLTNLVAHPAPIQMRVSFYA